MQEVVNQDGTSTQDIILPEAAVPKDASTSTQQQAIEIKAKKATKGELFYKFFQSQIDAHMLNKFEDFVKPLMSLLQNHTIIFHALLSLIDKHMKTKTVTPPAQRRAFIGYGFNSTSAVSFSLKYFIPVFYCLIFISSVLGLTPTHHGSIRNMH